MSAPEPEQRRTYATPLLASVSDLVALLGSRRFQRAQAARRPTATTFRQNTVIYALGQQGACRPSVIAEVVPTGRANVTRIVRSLEEAGLVATRPDPVDSRAVLHSLTERGVAVHDQLLALGDELIGTVTAEWTVEEIRTLQCLIERLRQGVLEALPEIGGAEASRLSR